MIASHVLLLHGPDLISHLEVLSYFFLLLNYILSTFVVRPIRTLYLFYLGWLQSVWNFLPRAGHTVRFFLTALKSRFSRAEVCVLLIIGETWSLLSFCILQRLITLNYLCKSLLLISSARSRMRSLLKVDPLFGLKLFLIILWITVFLNFGLTSFPRMKPTNLIISIDFKRLDSALPSMDWSFVFNAALYGAGQEIFFCLVGRLNGFVVDCLELVWLWLSFPGQRFSVIWDSRRWQISHIAGQVLFPSHDVGLLLLVEIRNKVSQVFYSVNFTF